MRATWLQRDIERGTTRTVVALFAVAQRLDLRVRQPRAPVPAASDDFPMLDEDCADQRVGGSLLVRAGRKAQRLTQERKI